MTKIHETPDDGVVDPMQLTPDTVVELFDGDQMAVVENPRDGVWVFARPVEDPAGVAQPVYADDIKTVVAVPADDSEG